MSLPRRALLTWELGDNFGHIAKLIKVGGVLRAAGVEVFVALQNLAGVAPLLDQLDATLLAAPYAKVKPPSDPKRPILTYADDLRPCGYDKPRELAALIRAWDGLYQLVQPDLLLVNSSPTALLAARPYTNMLKVAMGIGYEVPCLSEPMPPLRYWEKNNPEELQSHERSVLNVINEAQTILGRDAVCSIADMLRTDMSFITAFPEFDHYPNRVEGIYTGPFFVEDGGLDVTWRPRRPEAKRIFAYLSHGQDLNAVVQALHKSPHDVILVARRISEDNVKALKTNPHLQVFTDPVKIKQLTQGADVCLTHGGTGTFMQFLLQGVPQVIFPNHIEQLMVAKRMEEAGVGLIGTPQGDVHKVVTVIDRVLFEPQYTEKAGLWAQKHAGYSVDARAGEIGQALLEKMARN